MNFIQRFAETTAQGIDCAVNVCDTGLPKVDANGDQLATILQLVFAVLGVIALVYIIIAGFKLVTSLGNPEALAKARQSIIFAAIGLAIIVSAELIVSLVITRL